MDFKKTNFIKFTRSDSLSMTNLTHIFQSIFGALYTKELSLVVSLVLSLLCQILLVQFLCKLNLSVFQSSDILSKSTVCLWQLFLFELVKLVQLYAKSGKEVVMMFVFHRNFKPPNFFLYSVIGLAELLVPEAIYLHSKLFVLKKHLSFASSFIAISSFVPSTREEFSDKLHIRVSVASLVKYTFNLNFANNFCKELPYKQVSNLQFWQTNSEHFFSNSYVNWTLRSEL